MIILGIDPAAQMRGGRVKELVVKHARIADEYVGRDEAQFIRSSATAQHDLFAYLSECGRANVTELNKDFSAAALRNLVARGIVILEEEESLRTPYSGLDGERKKEVVLTPAQSAVAEKINHGEKGVYLLHGVTAVCIASRKRIRRAMSPSRCEKTQVPPILASYSMNPRGALRFWDL